MNNDFETIIGLEVHVQLDTNSKAFCSCSTDFESEPNSNICPVCCGYPGTLPVLNKRFLELSLRVALALNCDINRRVYFERKNYFYPDLPKNYQISQYKIPLGEGGLIDLENADPVHIKRVHMEEDAGKLIHKDGYSLVDFNRTGIPLLEIVSEPDIKSPQQAYDYLNTLKLIIQYIGASSCDMEKGYLRCDANISLRPHGDKKLGTKVELKNMNSFRGVRDGLSYEVKRQRQVLTEGGKLFQETRLWDNNKGCSVLMRTKEQAHDYRYFPEPDLVDYTVGEEMISQEKEFIGELPLKKKEKFLTEYGVKGKEADVLISSHYLADLFERTTAILSKPKEVSKWVIGPFLEAVNAKSINWQSIVLDAPRFAQIIKYFLSGKINNLAAKKVLLSAIDSDKDIDSIIQEQGLKQVSAEDELLRYVQDVINQHTKPVADFLNGKDKAIMFLVGQVMRKTRGKANPKVVRGLLEREIKKQ